MRLKHKHGLREEPPVDMDMRRFAGMRTPLGGVVGESGQADVVSARTWGGLSVGCLSSSKSLSGGVSS